MRRPELLTLDAVVIRALTLALAASVAGCAVPSARHNHKREAPAREAAVSQLSAVSRVAEPTALQKAAAPANDMAAADVRLASLADASGYYRAQPEPVPAPPPSPVLLTFRDGTTLGELEQLAQDSHPKLRAAIQEIEAAHGRTWQAGRMPNPSIGASSPQLAASESQYNIFVSQEIPTGGKLRLHQAAAAQEIDQAELSLSRTRYDVLTNVRRHFYATLVAQARVEVLQQQVAMANRSVEIVRMRFAAGEGTKTDVMLLEVNQQKAEVTLAGAKAALESQQRQLAAAVGIPDFPLDKLAGTLEPELPVYRLADLQQRVVASHSQTAIAAAEIRRRDLLVERAYAEPKPTFNVQGGYQRQVGPPQDQGILQVTMSVPLWDRNYGGIQAAEAAALKAQADLQRIETELASQAAAAYGRYVTAQQLAARYRDEILPKTRQALDLATRLYEAGEADFQTLLHAQESHAEAQLKYLEAQAARWESAIEIADLLQIEQFP